MCRWLAYSGSAIRIEDLLYRPKHSLIDQSLHSQLAETTNGDGFGVGWYDDARRAAVFRSTEPAWNDRNLREIAGHVTSPLVFAHIRASSGTPVQQTNCHPFRYDNWLWMHNGHIDDFAQVKRRLAFAVDPSLYPLIEGSTDSELFFFLALTFGLQDDPPSAVARAVGLIESYANIQMTVATTDGVAVWAFRYATFEKQCSLYVSAAPDALRRLYPDNLEFRRRDDETRLVVSEPLSRLPGEWQEVPEGSWSVVRPGRDELHAFVPKLPVHAGA